MFRGREERREGGRKGGCQGKSYLYIHIHRSRKQSKSHPFAFPLLINLSLSFPTPPTLPSSPSKLHSKTLVPKYEALAKIFAGEKDVIVAKVDATEQRDLATRFDVSGYPTLKFFPKGEGKEAQTYDKNREVDDFVAFLNEKAGTAYTAEGGLLPSAGRIPTLDALVASVGSISADTLVKGKAAVGELKGQAAVHGEMYLKAIEKVLAKGAAYVDTEMERLQKLVGGDNISPEKKAAFLLKSNILRAFKGEPVEEVPVTEEL
jgi:protein disulfide-isomerase A6